MTSPGKVSAVIIVLDGEQFIAEAIDSVLDQDYPDLELIVVDDGSLDRTREIVGDYTRRLPGKIRLVRHDDLANHGMSASRNRGLRDAAGEFVAFLDADDVWLPRKVSQQVEILQRFPTAAMTYGRTIIWYQWDQRGGKQDHHYSLGVDPETLQLPPTLFRQLLRNVDQTPTTCNALIRRLAINAVGGFDRSFPDVFEDQLFFAKLLAQFPVFVSGRTWAKYRQHEGSFSSRETAAGEGPRTHRRYLAALRRYLQANDALDAGSRLAIRRASLLTWTESGRLVVRALRRRLGR